MQFPTQFPFLVIPTGAGPGQQRITINFGQDGKIKVYDQNGNLVDAIGGPQGQFILYDSSGNMVISLASTAGTDDRTGLPFQAGITTYTSTTSINLFQNDITVTASNGSKVVIESANEASVFLTPPTATGPWFAGLIGTQIFGSNHPGTIIESPTDSVNGVLSQISLLGSSTTSATTSIFLQSSIMNSNGLNQFGNMVLGSVVITPSAVNTPTSATVNYSTLQGSAFFGFTNNLTSVPQNVSSVIRSITSTSATVTLTRTDNTTATTVQYMVWGQ